MVHPAAGAVSFRFGAQCVFRDVPAEYHAGIDIRALAGAPILAPADGVVVLALMGESFTGDGHLVSSVHSMGLDSAMLQGGHQKDGFASGYTIGEDSMTGLATALHLH
jgi:murein DD-endopeptidase MepM/ murein hydrolase activator NlpD